MPKTLPNRRHHAPARALPPRTRDPIVMTVRQETAWMYLRDLSRRARGESPRHSQTAARMSRIGASLAFHHEIGVQVGFVSRRPPAERRSRTDALLSYAERMGLEGIESLVWNAVFDAVDRGDREQAARGSSIFDTWVERRKAMTGPRLIVVDERGRLEVHDPGKLRDMGLSNIVGELGSNSASFHGRMESLRPDPGQLHLGGGEDRGGASTPSASGNSSGSGPKSGVKIHFFGKSGLVEVSVNGHGTDIAVGTAADGAVLGAAAGAAVGAAGVGAVVGTVIGAIVGLVAAIADWMLGQQAEGMKLEITKMFDQLKEDMKDLEKKFKAFDEALKKKDDTTNNDNDDNDNDNDDNDDDDDDDDNDDNNDDEPDEPDEPDDGGGGGDEMPGWDEGNEGRATLDAATLRRIVALLGSWRGKGATDGPRDNPFYDGESTPSGDIDLVELRLDPALDLDREAQDRVPPRIQMSWRDAVKRYVSDGKDHGGEPTNDIGAIGGTIPSWGGGHGPVSTGSLFKVSTGGSSWKYNADGTRTIEVAAG